MDDNSKSQTNLCTNRLHQTPVILKLFRFAHSSHKQSNFIDPCEIFFRETYDISGHKRLTHKNHRKHSGLPYTVF